MVAVFYITEEAVTINLLPGPFHFKLLKHTSRVDMSAFKHLWNCSYAVPPRPHSCVSICGLGL